MKVFYFPVRSSSGRNNLGRLISFRKGGGLKKKLLFLDFKRTILKVPAIIKSVTYNSFRSSFISLICYKNGYISHILSAKGLKKDDEIIAASCDFVYNIGDTLPMRFISIGTLIYNIELYPFGGAQLVRSAGLFAKVLKQDLFYTHVRMPSGEERMINNKCKATIGVVSNETHYLKKFKKAGILRNLGRRPTVRGIAMNPVDHPNGGRTKGGTPFSDR
jgi:large subunit ribosomal protein L2